MRSEPEKTEPAGQTVQLFLWFLAPSINDDAVRRALQLASERLIVESTLPLSTEPVHYRRVRANEVSESERDLVSTWMDVHPPVAAAQATDYLALVDQINLETGLTDLLQGKRHAEWFSCA